MMRPVFLAVIWVAVAPAATYGALLAINALTPASIDPLWFIVPLFLLVGIGTFYLFSPKTIHSLILLLILPPMLLLFSGASDSAAPGAEYLGVAVGAILLFIGWMMAFTAHKVAERRG